MKTIPGSRKHRYMTIVSTFLIMVALIAGMIGCDDDVDPPLDLEIRNWNDLNAVRDNLGGNHRLMNDLDSDTAGYEALASATANEGKGWQPLGTLFRPFTGTFDGQGYEINDLVINRPGEALVGFFSVVSEEGVIGNVSVVNAVVTGYTIAGGLVASNFGLVANTCFSGNVTGYSSVGGLVGDNAGTVNNSYSIGWVTCIEENSGGLIGANSGTVNNSYSAANANGEQYVGGLVGYISSGNVNNSYATGNVTGDDYVGGLVGSAPLGAVSDSFWDKETSGTVESDGGTDKTTAEMQSIATFSDAGWDIVVIGAYVDETWYIDDGNDYPRLGWQFVG